MPSQSVSSRLFCLALFIVFSMSLAGCGGDEKAAPEKQAAVPMKVVKAETKDMPLWGEFVATITAVETVDIRARVAGFLQEKKFKEGAAVEKGDLLFIIDPKTFREDLKQAESGLQYNQALLQKAKKDFERFKKLYDEGVVSREEFESYQTSLATYKAQVRDNSSQVENAKIQLGYTKIYAPVDGVIGRVNVDTGNLVGQGENTLLATVSTVDPVYVSFTVSEADYLRAKRDRDIKDPEKKEVHMILADGSEYDHLGTFDMVDRAVDPTTGTLGIRVSFPNPDSLLRPGQYAKVRVPIEIVKNAVVVPSRAIIDTQGVKTVYTVSADGKVVSTPVTAGFESEEMVVIREGLKAGDMVIADGIRRVRPGMEIKPIVVPMTTKQGEGTPVGQNDAPATEDKAE